ncbi:MULTISPECIES: prepilin-type N-terminal cleavage/methylation domain-containing protein [unclassified Thioalkalivibrio]|uniref:prepilin-type N-terminal cleavage/methylation domain-containing protein n=1 Tax=unclassified Thioalkalivibrio TaxID=2621013 RepID=UPI00037485D6|nr:MULTISPECIES: prepilin-type N-terminal cleavage/methylation domain-containing protein [unclassified Thioalkalivibrio]
MHLETRRIHSGISLIEALIAIAIVSLGLLAIAKLHGELTSSTTTSKARAEAMQLAETQMDSLRNALTTTELETALQNIEQAGIEGINATFDVSTSPSPGDLLPPSGDLLELQVTVSWTDPRGEIQQVQVRSNAAWNDPLFSVNLARGRLPHGDLVDPPAGSGEMGGELLDSDYTLDQPPNVLDDGTEIRRSGSTIQLVDTTTSEALITMESPDPDNLDLGFSIIRGRVFVDDNITVDHGDVGVVSSDAGVCTRIYSDQYATRNDRVTDAQLIEDPEFDRPYFAYQCYVGRSWFGNIGLVRLVDADITNRVCVGDPAFAPEPESIGFEPRPALTTVRRYRGFVSTGDSFRTVGIGTPGAHSGFEEHDFLITGMRGNADHEDCVDALSSNGTSNDFQGNPGRYVCLLTNSDQCADPEDADPTSYWVFSGAYDIPDDVALESINAIFGTETMECSVEVEFLGQSDNIRTATYECAVNVEGLGDAFPDELRASFSTDEAVICTPESVSLEEGATIDLLGDRLGYTFENVASAEQLPDGIDFQVTASEELCAFELSN